MTNENIEDVVSSQENDNEVVEETTEEESENGEDNFVKVPREEYNKTISTLGSLKRELKDLKKPKEDSKEAPQSDSLGEKAFLAVNGIKGSDELAFFQKMKKETGKSTEDLLDSTYFQTELKDFREKKSTEKATPTGSKRSSNSSVNTVEYWIAKGELPPASEVQLRRDVVNARIKKESNQNPFG